LKLPDALLLAWYPIERFGQIFLRRHQTRTRQTPSRQEHSEVGQMVHDSTLVSSLCTSQPADLDLSCGFDFPYYSVRLGFCTSVRNTRNTRCKECLLYVSDP
jgi:hypothetical protein